MIGERRGKRLHREPLVRERPRSATLCKPYRYPRPDKKSLVGVERLGDLLIERAQELRFWQRNSVLSNESSTGYDLSLGETCWCVSLQNASNLIKVLENTRDESISGKIVSAKTKNDVSGRVDRISDDRKNPKVAIA